MNLRDINKDGHPDLLFVREGDSRWTSVNINDGEGYFRELDRDWIEPLNGLMWVLDVDGDGGGDIVDTSAGELRLHKMNLPYGPDLNGTEADDRNGGARNNVFRGLAGNDVLDAGLGNDWLVGGMGNDILIGGKGNDGYAWVASDLAGHDR